MDNDWAVIANKEKHSSENYKRSFDRKIIENLSLVNFVVNKYANNNKHKEDLIQSGYIGLIQSVERYDLSRGVMFSTYAFNNIKRYVLMTLFKDRGVSVPLWCNQLRSDIISKQKEAEMNSLPEPTVFELASSIGVGEVTVRGFLNSKNISSITTGSDDWKQSSKDLGIPTPEEDTIVSVDASKVLSIIDKLVDRNAVKARNRDIFLSSVGIRGHDKNSSILIGKEYGLSGSAVRCICKQVIEKIKNEFSLANS